MTEPFQLVYKGLRVPWVTRWSGEVLEDHLTVMEIVERDGGPMLAFKSATAMDRDRQNIMWARESVNAQGEGEAQFKMVHSGRHRVGMRMLRCQVCGRQIKDRPIPWLFVPSELEAVMAGDDSPDGRPTSTMPTCEECWPVAESLCPHLKGGGVVRTYVREVRPWGVGGDLFQLDGSYGRAQIPYGHPALRLAVAKQAMVTVIGVKEAT